MTDGISPPRLVKDIMPGFAGSNPTQLTSVDSTVFFTADDGVNGRELWKSDGTEFGTQLVADIYPGMGDFGDPHSSSPIYLTAALTATTGYLFFVAQNDVSGVELWATDGFQTVLVSDINSGDDPSGNPRNSSPGICFFGLNSKTRL
ncbi:MAG: ELWxxDGT repeat protein [Pirellulaceae bacterium]